MDKGWDTPAPWDMHNTPPPSLTRIGPPSPPRFPKKTQPQTLGHQGAGLAGHILRREVGSPV